jgi:hypothetical protein
MNGVKSFEFHSRLQLSNKLMRELLIFNHFMIKIPSNQSESHPS